MRFDAAHRRHLQRQRRSIFIGDECDGATAEAGAGHARAVDACLAARDIFFTLGLPVGLRTGLYPAMRMLALGTISILTLAAAVCESLYPGTVIARRCYFAGAALYFFGTGYINFIQLHSWQSIMMLITGCSALGAAIYAKVIVESETEEALDLPADSEDLTQIRAQEHHKRVLAREWKDPAEKEQ